MRAPAPAASVESPRSSRVETVTVISVVGLMIVLRFTTRSALWLDEALSANVAELQIGEMPDALGRDGHPPLYYVLLHGWMELFGRGDAAVRAMSGVFSVMTLPLAWMVGARRAGRAGAMAVLLVVAVTPFNLRYATETRMYSLVMLLVFVALLLAEDLRERWSTPRAIGLSLVTAALLWTHYWSLWLGASAAALLLVVGLRESGAPRRRTFSVLACLGAGLVLFLPWVPTLLRQASDTGTPWALPATPPRVVEQLTFHIGGGEFPEPLVFSMVLFGLVIVGLFARPVAGSSHRMDLDLRTVPGVRAEALVAVGTVMIGLLAGYATRATFAPRYAATFLPFLLVVAGVGIVRLPSRLWRGLAAGVLVAMALGGAYRNVTEERTQGHLIAEAIDADASPADLVVFCPDQLGPAVDRRLVVPEQRVVFPTFQGPELIDWTDYAARNEAADVEAFASEAIRRAAGADLWYVWSGDYRTLEEACPELLEAFATVRPGGEVVPNGGEAFFEHAALWRFKPAGG